MDVKPIITDVIVYVEYVFEKQKEIANCNYLVNHVSKRDGWRNDRQNVDRSATQL